MPRFKILLLFFIAYSCICTGQKEPIYNINKYNGLPSNHVYTILKDKLGYLWIGTTHGILKYNGYTFTKYGYKEGLPNIDIWSIYEDESGKIWPLSIAPEIGYIYNNTYKRIPKIPIGWTPDIYPKTMAELDKTIVFATVSPNRLNPAFGIIKNDTLSLHTIPHDYSKSGNFIGQVICNNASYLSFDSSVCIKYDIKSFLKNPDKPRQEFSISDSAHSLLLQEEEIVIEFANRYAVCRKTGASSISIYDFKKHTISKIDFSRYKTGRIIISYPYKYHFYCITSDRIFVIDTNKKIVQNLLIESLYKGKLLTGSTNTFFLDDAFWGEILTTSNNGMYIKYNDINTFILQNEELSDYTYIGSHNDTLGYWWNNDKHLLALVSKGKIISSVTLNTVDLRKAIVYDNEHILLLSRVQNWLKGGKNLLAFEHVVAKNLMPQQKNSGYYYSNDIVLEDKHTIHILGNTFIGIYTLNLDSNMKVTGIHTLDLYRYKNIALNKKNNILIAYTYNRVFIYNTATEKKIILNSKNLENLNISGIEKIFVDDYGNVFIKDFDKLVAYNINQRYARRLFKNMRLEGAIIEVKNNNIYIAGGFGLLTCRVNGSQSITNTKFYPNTKSIFYNHVNSAQFSQDGTTLNTNNGTYYIHTKADDVRLSEGLSKSYVFIARYNTTEVLLKPLDTLNILQNSSLTLDVIKPSGTGELKISFWVDGVKYSQAEFQLLLANLQPGIYQTLGINASDDSWESKPLKCYIYVMPKWWQTSFAKNTILVISVILFLCIIYVVIVLTRKIVNRNNDRKNQRRELELKSIYSQINPHFIFNSLSTAQYFVKKNRNKEAYEHINQFSDLLRSYIKSSRDKYITIAEELNNLENYLQLQLTRFEDKFDYNFHVEPIINSKLIKIPSLLLQPLVENALNHGIFHSDKKGLLTISFTIDDSNNLICMVDDNGIGRQRSKELRSELIRKADSYGNILIKELIDTFNKYETINIELQYVDKVSPESGTTVIIKIKNYMHVQ